MTKPLMISVGLLVVLFGLACAKVGDQAKFEANQVRKTELSSRSQ
jgi:hypothetical protein